jgi:hypothetical protein
MDSREWRQRRRTKDADGRYKKKIVTVPGQGNNGLKEGRRKRNAEQGRKKRGNWSVERYHIVQRKRRRGKFTEAK